MAKLMYAILVVVALSALSAVPPARAEFEDRELRTDDRELKAGSKSPPLKAEGKDSSEGRELSAGSKSPPFKAEGKDPSEGRELSAKSASPPEAKHVEGRELSAKSASPPEAKHVEGNQA